MEDRIKQYLKTIKLNESLLSMLFGLVTVVLIGILIFRLYRANKPEISPEAEQTQVAQEKVGEVEVKVDEAGNKVPVSLPETYTVTAGDHLWAIAEKHYGSGYNWVDIAKENALSNPGLIAEGMELKLPKVPVKEVKSATSTAEVKTTDKIEGTSYTVVKGDNLWQICVRAYSDGYKWAEVAKANNMQNPDLIEVGQVITLPR